MSTSTSGEGPANSRDGGAALVIALMAILLLLALGLALVIDTATETSIAAHFVSGQEAFYAADAGLERAMDELGSAVDWSRVLAGAERSAFIDGAPSGSRTLPDGSAIDLTNASNLLNCGHAGACTPADMDASRAGRRWGPNNPRWRLYAHGPLNAIAPAGTINSSLYVAVWVSDDASENDDDPATDGAGPSNPGSGVLTVHAEAFGPGGIHRVVEATVARQETSPPLGIRLLAWRLLN